MKKLTGQFHQNRTKNCKILQIGNCLYNKLQTLRAKTLQLLKFPSCKILTLTRLIWNQTGLSSSQTSNKALRSLNSSKINYKASHLIKSKLQMKIRTKFTALNKFWATKISWWKAMITLRIRFPWNRNCLIKSNLKCLSGNLLTLIWRLFN